MIVDSDADRAHPATLALEPLDFSSEHTGSIDVSPFATEAGADRHAPQGTSNPNAASKTYERLTPHTVPAGLAPLLTCTELSPSRFQEPCQYPSEVALKQALPLARQALSGAIAMIDNVVGGQPLHAEHVEQTVHPLVTSVIGNPDALLWLSSLHPRDRHSAHDVVLSCVLAAAFGRQMGFSEDVLVSLGAGALITAVTELVASATSTDKVVIGAVGPNRDEADHALEVARAGGVTQPDVLDMLVNQRERYNGSGVPQGLVGDAISIPAQMLGMTQAYLNMSHGRSDAAAMSAHQALRELYAVRDNAFAGDLVDAFQSLLGVYPTGSLVQLNTGETALVMAQNLARRLRPRLILLSTSSGEPLSPFRVLDLNQNDSALQEMHIKRTVAADTFTFDPTELLLT